jgi:hypothetical protein
MYNAPVIFSILKPSPEALRLDVEERSVISMDCSGTPYPFLGATLQTAVLLECAFSHALRPYLTCPLIHPKATRTPGFPVFSSRSSLLLLFSWGFVVPQMILVSRLLSTALGLKEQHLFLD